MYFFIVFVVLVHAGSNTIPRLGNKSRCFNRASIARSRAVGMITKILRSSEDKALGSGLGRDEEYLKKWGA